MFGGKLWNKLQLSPHQDLQLILCFTEQKVWKKLGVIKALINRQSFKWVG